jgi:uncharacterized caspase-like protein
MNRILQFAGAAAIAASVLGASPALAQDKKVALVIGNAAYTNVVSLKNPVNDAADTGDALKRIGFAVTTLSNAPVVDMRRSLKAFGEKAKLAEVAVVFYSGHALQSDGVAWLLASDGQARSLADITKGSISLPEILEQLEGVEKAGVVFIDAARNDPFGEAQKRQLPSGLKKQVEEPKNVLVSFATGAGRKVADGEGRNSPFTTALLKHIEEPGLELIALMKRLREDVVRSTAGEQVPSFYISAADDAYFVAALPKPAPAQPASPEPAPAAVPQAAAPDAPAEPAPAPQAAVPAAEPAAPAAPVAVAPDSPIAAAPAAIETPAAPSPEAPASDAAAPAAPAEKTAEAPAAEPAPAESAPAAEAPAAEADKPAADATAASSDAADSTEKKGSE